MSVSLIAGDKHLETLRNCGGFYRCPKDAQGKRLGPLAGYAGTYKATDGANKQFVGDVYVNFAMAEKHPEVLKFFAHCLLARIDSIVGLKGVNVLCTAPIGGYDLGCAMGQIFPFVEVIKMEKKVLAVATAEQREQSKLVFNRHTAQKDKVHLIIEDVCNNFSTTGKAIDLIHEGDGIVGGIACFLDRSPDVDEVFYHKGVSYPVMAVVREPMPEYRQDDPLVVYDVATGNVEWKPKDKSSWERLMKAMDDYFQL